MENKKFFSEKLGKEIEVSAELNEDFCKVILEDAESSLVGWTHGGWNNENGGAGW